jgi:uncharacterized protein YuzB (UPF0349 family)
MKVRFCEHNKGAAKICKRLKESYPKLDVKLKDCIKKCGPCHKTLFAVVDGKTISALDGDELVRKILAEKE